MKIFVFFIFLISSHAFAGADLVGTWKLTAYIYDGQPIPLPNPALDLRFIFYANGISKLHWFRRDEPGFCERKAVYSVTENVLYQKNIWNNPLSDRSCATDSDMRPNAESYTVFHIKDGYLYLELALDDKPFIYILRFLPDETQEIQIGNEITKRVNGLRESYSN